MRFYDRNPGTPPIGIGEASVRNEATSLRLEALTSVGIVDRVAVKVDRENRAIGFAKPKGESYTYALTPRAGSKCRDIKTVMAIRTMGLEPTSVAGRYCTEIRDGVIWIRLEVRHTAQAAANRIAAAIAENMRPFNRNERADIAACVATELRRFARPEVRRAAR